VCQREVDREGVQERRYPHHDAETVFLSSPIFKFNDYKKKQERNILVTSMGVFNLKSTSTPPVTQPSSARSTSRRSKPSPSARSAPSSSSTSPRSTTTGTPLPSPSYASADRRDQIIYFILKAYRVTTGQKLPIYYRDELNLVNYATTKEEKKKEGIKEIKGEFVMHDDVSFQVYLEGE
jgi:serum/glucocorticoid-regulated kinase 2